MTEHIPETAIQPYLSPQYWDGHLFGDGDNSPSVPLTDHSTKNEVKASLELMKYVARGAGKLALRQFIDGETFDANDYQPGTIIRTTQESLTSDGPNDPAYRPMTNFNSPDTPHRPRIATEEQVVEGHGYTYEVKQWVNVVVAAKRSGNGVLLVPANVIDTEPALEKIVKSLHCGSKQFTVGTTYHFAGNNETLTRVSNLVVCISGGSRRRKRNFLAWVPGLKAADNPTV
ncbi:MAG TPA: hypothetical protein VLE73_03360 [Candidatus Saccharimonadales bacterium]|nr:hypothetical protein [Candidatus Saccharimonadales bacterium]